MPNRSLTDDEIRECAARNAAGETVKRLAFEYGVGVTTMWEAIHPEKRRAKKYQPVPTKCEWSKCGAPLANHPRCRRCSRLIHDGEPGPEWEGPDGVCRVLGAGGLCYEHYCQAQSFPYPATDHRHTDGEVAKVMGVSVEQVAAIGAKAYEKIRRDPRLLKAARSTDAYSKLADAKLRQVEKLLADVPQARAIQAAIEEYRRRL